jgi:hypothetical protein
MTCTFLTKLITLAKKPKDLKLIAAKANQPNNVADKALRLEFKTVDKLYVFNSI